MSRANYKMTQGTLYSVADSIITSLGEAPKLAKFAAKKPAKYVPGILIVLKGLRDTAFNMPDQDQVSSLHETRAIELENLAQPCEDNLQDLKTYIHDGWAKEFWKVKYDEAGMVDYEQASHKNWESVVKMNKKMNDFIGNYPAELTTGHMPAGFALQVQNDSDAFDLKYTDFKSSRETAALTAAKINANNELYAALQDIQNDAHAAFRRDPEGMSEFIIEDVKKLVSPPGSASLGMTFIEVGTNLPLANVKVTIQSASGIAMVQVSAADGTLDFVSIDSDNYRVLIQVPGKPDMHMTKEVNTGVNARMKVMV